MLDITFRPVKDRLFDPLCNLVPSFVTPLQVTVLAFISGIAACYAAAISQPGLSVLLWLVNRAFDCIDGALARQRKLASDLGGFLDLLNDFIIYSAIPICCAISWDDRGYSGLTGNSRLWLSVSVLEATFHVNNFILFYIAAILEKRKAEASSADRRTAKGKKVDEGVKELTSVMMRPALIEGLESGVIFTLMLVRTDWTELVSWTMAGLVCVGIIQRVLWVIPVLR